jgi:hypothetical protein
MFDRARQALKANDAQSPGRVRLAVEMDAVTGDDGGSRVVDKNEKAPSMTLDVGLQDVG